MKGVVLGLGPGDVEGVVEEQGVGVDGGQAGDLPTGTVDDHLAQSTGLGVDSPPAVGDGNEGAAGGLTGLCHGHRVTGGSGKQRAHRPPGRAAHGAVAAIVNGFC